MAKKRIVVTGMGIVSCLGNDVDTFYQALLSGKSGITSIQHFPCEDYPTRFAGNIIDFDPSEYIDKKQARRIDKCIAYGLVAGKKALQMAKISPNQNQSPKPIGVLIGSGMGGMSIFANSVQDLLEKGHKRVSPFFVPYTITNMAGALLAIDYGFTGPNYSISTACATGNNCIVAAAEHIRKGDADIMVCGGTEGAIIPIGLAGFCALKALSQRNDAPEKASRPWDLQRDGFVMGEGAGVIVLESLESALARNVPILAEYLGGGLSCDAFDMTSPRPGGATIAQCIRNALEDAGVKAEDVNYVNAHATSTPAGDMVEIAALKQVLPQPEKVLINATKSMVGHALGAAAGIEAVVTIKTITDGVAHPNPNLEDPEPELAFHAPKKAEKIDVKVAISNSFGFGGHNATIVFAPYRP